MGKEIAQLMGFNRGRVSSLSLARTDVKRIALSADVMTNYVPRVLGSMMMRPGLKYLGSSASDAAAKYIPFIFSTDDTALVELTDSLIRVWVSDALVTRGSVSSAVTNGTFDTDVASWTDNDEVGAASTWATGGYLQLLGDGTNAAIRDQTVTVVAADQGDEHALRIVINRGKATLRVGSTVGGDEYITETELDTGTHSLTFTPTGDFHIRLMSRLNRIVLVDSVAVEASGVMTISAPWTTNLSSVRWDQSGDVLFIACEGVQQRRIERRSTRSWSVVLYQPEDGPFRTENTGPITITPSALNGNITLTASASLFRSTLVGALFKLTSEGQRVTSGISAMNTFTNTIRVTNVGESRRFTITLSGTWVATVTLQRSIGETGNWEDVTTYTTNVSTTYADGLDNQVVFYRIGVKTSEYTSGTVTATLNYPLGSITGVARITAYTSGTVVNAEVLTDFGDTDPTDVWAEGAWSSYRGYPTSVALYEGRLWWSGKNGIWGSVSDAFDVFDPDFEGDAGPISRTIGAGPVDVINWILPMQRLILGAEGAELAARSTSFDEPLTITNFNIKEISTQGSAAVAAVRVDTKGMFVQRSGTRIYELGYSIELQDYQTTDLTQLVPEIGEPSISRMAVQRQPDTRIHCVRSDGTVALAVIERSENVLAWIDIETDGDIEDVVVLPGTTEDSVYYHVKRTINGSTKRYLEKWALESEGRGGTTNKLADSFLVYSGTGTTTITGLSHLENETVVVWGNGKDLGTKTVISAEVTGLSEAVTTACVGLSYEAQWKSTKLAYATQQGSALTQKKRLSHVGMILADTHAQGIKFGPDFDNLDDMPMMENEVAVDQDSVHDTYDEEGIEFPGTWDTDSRICLQSEAPRPCTVLALVIPVETNEKL